MSVNRSHRAERSEGRTSHRRVAQESLELYGAQVPVDSSLAATATEVPKRLPYQGERS